MDRTEVDIPYIGGPLDGQREIRERWEMDEQQPGSREGDVHEHKPALIHSDADAAEVHRYRLTRRDGRWEYHHED
jgi:hypothetical protein